MEAVIARSYPFLQLIEIVLLAGGLRTQDLSIIPSATGCHEGSIIITLHTLQQVVRGLSDKQTQG